VARAKSIPGDAGCVACGIDCSFKRPEDSWRPNRFVRFHGSLEYSFLR
jgi:hypothetical protein